MWLKEKDEAFLVRYGDCIQNDENGCFRLDLWCQGTAVVGGVTESPVHRIDRCKSFREKPLGYTVIRGWDVMKEKHRQNTTNMTMCVLQGKSSGVSFFT